MSVAPNQIEFQQWLVDLRRQIHRKPELMFEEFETAALVANTLADLGIPCKTGIAETGVVAMIGSGEGPCVALRADMDALPIHEEADIPFRSEVDGKMHACGHDCHTAMLLGAARLLKEHESNLQGTVKLIFQPAEEGGGGAFKMCQDGVLEHPRVQQIFGLHVWPGLPTGEVASRTGILLSAAGGFEITVVGKGGHGAMPHTCIDPIVTASKIVVELQSIVSRECDPFDPSVVTIGSFHGGNAMNVIPESVVLQGTYRSLSREGGQKIMTRIEELVDGIARANRCQASIKELFLMTPPTVNDACCAEAATEAARNVDEITAVRNFETLLAGEDFAFYQEVIPGCFSFLGVADSAWQNAYSVHHPKFRVDERALPIGAKWHFETAKLALKKLTEKSNNSSC